MPSLAEYQIDPDQEMKYRRGYIHAAHEMITAVGERLSESEKTMLLQWASGPLLKWSRGDGEFLPPPTPYLP
jgi:hypothetical protein